MFVRISRVGPADPASLAELSLGRLDNFSPADFVESFGREFTDNQLPALVEHPYLVLVPNHVNIGPSGFGYGVEVFPDAISRLQIQTAKLAVAVNAVNVVPLNDGGGYAAMETICIFFAFPYASPDFLDG